MLEEEVRRVHDISNPYLICMRLASMLQGDLGVTGTGMPCFYDWTGKKLVFYIIYCLPASYHQLKVRDFKSGLSRKF